MKIYRLPQLAEANPEGTYMLDGHELNSSSVHMLYGKIRPGEAPKKLSPAEGSDEIIFVLKGSLRVRCGKTAAAIGPGEAFHLKSTDAYFIENTGNIEAAYIAAGGSSTNGVKAVEKQAAPAPQEAALQEEKPVVVEEETEFIITRDNSTEED
ncbi:MAG TPA: cupin domain-containing protein [Thermodesulfobacteriota bacterium]